MRMLFLDETRFISKYNPPLNGSHGIESASSASLSSGIKLNPGATGQSTLHHLSSLGPLTSHLAMGHSENPYST